MVNLEEINFLFDNLRYPQNGKVLVLKEKISQNEKLFIDTFSKNLTVELMNFCAFNKMPLLSNQFDKIILINTEIGKFKVKKIFKIFNNHLKINGSIIISGKFGCLSNDLFKDFYELIEFVRLSRISNYSTGFYIDDNQNYFILMNRNSFNQIKAFQLYFSEMDNLLYGKDKQ